MAKICGICNKKIGLFTFKSQLKNGIVCDTHLEPLAITDGGITTIMKKQENLLNISLDDVKKAVGGDATKWEEIKKIVYAGVSSSISGSICGICGKKTGLLNGKLQLKDGVICGQHTEPPSPLAIFDVGVTSIEIMRKNMLRVSLEDVNQIMAGDFTKWEKIKKIVHNGVSLNADETIRVATITFAMMRKKLRSCIQHNQAIDFNRVCRLEITAIASADSVAIS